MKKQVECKSIGIPLTEEVARKVDALVKQLPKECNYRRKGTVPEVAELVTGERADISMISVESVDRDGDVVLAKGLDVEMFQRNPVVTFCHRYDCLPVGRAIWVKKVSGGVRAKTIYTDAHELAVSCWKCVQTGFLKGKSIGFLPTKIRSATQEEISRNPAWKNANSVIESAVLLEFSVAPIPVNQDALVEAVSKGITDKATLKMLGFKLPEPKRLSQEELAAVINRELAKGAASLTPACILQKVRDSYSA